MLGFSIGTKVLCRGFVEVKVLWAELHRALFSNAFWAPCPTFTPGADSFHLSASKAPMGGTWQPHRAGCVFGAPFANKF